MYVHNFQLSYKMANKMEAIFKMAAVKDPQLQFTT